MRKLFEIVKERREAEIKLSDMTRAFNEIKNDLTETINELTRLENIGQDGMDLSKIQLAETVMYVRGNPYGKSDGSKVPIAELAVIDIANESEHLKKSFYGNKTYSGYYQRCDCSYGMGPSHGGICDEIGLHREYRDKVLTDDQKDACIYYLKNYQKIQK